MREFVFTVEYDAGVDDLMDLFVEYPDLHSRTVSVHASADTVWKLTRVTGSSDALDAFDDCLSEMAHTDDVVGMCGSPVTTWDYEILSRSADARVVYTRQTESDAAHSIPSIAAKHVGEGLLMQAQRRGNQYRWRLLVDDDDTVGTIHDELEERLRDGLSIRVERLSDPQDWVGDRVRADDLPPEQRAALEAAVQYGYYETPRRHSLQDIAAELDVPNSTLQYRLRRAEAWLATRFVSTVLDGAGYGDSEGFFENLEA